MTWHADAATLDAYDDGALDDVTAMSVEAHVVACADCRAHLATRFDVDRSEEIWSGVIDAIDGPRALPGERLLARLGVPPHQARLLATVPAARLSGLVAVVSVLLFATIVARGLVESRLPLLVLAPLAPVLGVALAYGKGVDPLYELGLSSPTGGLRLLLTRSAVVLTFSASLSAFISVVVPGVRGGAVWLLPSLVLTLLTLALSGAVGSTAAASASAGVWLGGVLLVARLSHRSDAAFEAPAQAWFAVMVVVLVAVIVFRRRSFEQI